MADSTTNDELNSTSRKWLVTGVAGFIGSHLAERLVKSGQSVVGLDDFSTGSEKNVEFVASTAREAAGEFQFLEGSIEHASVCAEACSGVDIVLHQAALGSIPRSIENPLRTHEVNATGTLNMLTAAKAAKVARFVYASSSSVYGDDRNLPKVESRTGLPLAPYATSKRAGEYYARNFADHFGMQTVGLRYFNVFGPRQDPGGAYAAVVPKWISQLSRGEQVTIYGDGETSRDFCYVANVVQANLRAALTPVYDPAISVFNIAAGGRTTLNELHAHIVRMLGTAGSPATQPLNGPERKGDVRHSQADISLAMSKLGYAPTHDIIAGLEETVSWFRSQS